MVVFLATTDGGTIKAIPQNFHPAELLVFSSWRHALAFCDVAGVEVENRNIADLLAAEEGAPGPQEEVTRA
jgi:hypothetical protein